MSLFLGGGVLVHNHHSKDFLNMKLFGEKKGSVTEGVS